MDLEVEEVREIKSGSVSSGGMIITVSMTEWMLKDAMAIICEELGGDVFMEEVKRIIDA